MEGERPQPILDDKICFFKVLVPRLWEARLEIPKEFVLLHLSQEPYNRASLYDTRGNVWSVKIRLRYTGTYIEEGWGRFARDHSLRNYYFLVFAYDYHHSFHVIIFDPSGCMRVIDHSHDRNPGNPSEAGPYRRNADIEMKDTEEAGPSRINADVQMKNEGEVAGPPGRKADVEIKVREEEDDTDEDLPTSQPTLAPAAPREWSLCYKEPRSEASKAKVRGIVESFTSTFPSMLKYLSALDVGKGGILFIPVEFQKLHLHFRREANIKLRTTDGNETDVKMIKTLPGQAYLSKGWTTFATENGLKEGDVCIFEFLGPSEVQVHIFR